MSTISPESWRAASAYLDQALERSGEQREIWLAAVQERDPALAKLLQKLLNEHDAVAPEHFPELRPVPLLAPAMVRAGSRVGAYRLLALIGEGGMGAVWLAPAK